MLNIRQILKDSYYTASIITEGDEPSGDQTLVALNDLNKIIYNLNLDNYMPFTRNSITVQGLPNKEEYTIGLSGCDITAPTPVLLQTIYVKASPSARFTGTKRVSYEQIWGLKSVPAATGIPSFFSYDRTWPNGRLVMNINPLAGLIMNIIYNKELPEVNINSILDIPPEYYYLLQNSLAVIIMKRYKVDPPAVAQIEGQVNYALNQIKKRNNIDKIITWSDSSGGMNGPTGLYYNMFSPVGWS